MLSGLAVMLALAGVMVFVFVTKFTGSEPTSQGKPLRYWLNQRVETKPFSASPFRFLERHELSPDAVEAIQAIGEEALPALLNRLKVPVTDIRKRVLLLFGTHRTGEMMGYTPMKSILGFKALGPDAIPAIPRLLELLHDPQNLVHAAQSLCAIGPEGANALIGEFDSLSSISRRQVIVSLHNAMTGDLESVMTDFFIRLLREESDEIQLHSVLTCISFFDTAVNHNELVDTLEGLINHKSNGMRSMAGQALGNLALQGNEAALVVLRKHASAQPFAKRLVQLYEDVQSGRIGVTTPLMRFNALVVASNGGQNSGDVSSQSVR